MSNYIALLQSNEWKVKREQILLRDNHQCQRCGTAKAENLRTLYMSVTADTLQSFSKIEICRDPELNVNILKLEKNGNTFICKTYLQENSLHTGGNYTIALNYAIRPIVVYPFQGSVLSNNKSNIFHDIRNNLFIRTKLSLTQKLKANVEFDLEGIWFIPAREEVEFTKRNISLHVHHKCYRANKQIWDQDDDEYVTLCNICHRVVHETTKIPFYDKNGVNYELRTQCERCNGMRYFECYKHINGGSCFKCNGQGYY